MEDNLWLLRIPPANLERNSFRFHETLEPLPIHENIPLKPISV